MKYRLGSVTIEAIDTYVRITVANIGGPDARDRVAVTKKQCPNSDEVAKLIAEMRGYWPDESILQACKAELLLMTAAFNLAKIFRSGRFQECRA